jgi:hypothetical protein
MISGFFYSGSGAVLDYLRGFDGFQKWPPKGEYRIIKAPGGVHDYMVSLARGGDVDIAAVDLYLSVVGKKKIRKGLKRRRAWETANGSNGRLACNPKYAAHQAHIYHMLADLFENTSREKNETIEAIREHMARALGSAAQSIGAERLLIDQAANAWRINLGNYFPLSTFIVVDRDPRDQFAEAQMAWKRLTHMSKSVEKWVDDYLPIRKNYSQDMSAMQERGYKFVEMQFESFVTNHDKDRIRLHSALNLDYSLKPVEHYFSVGTSRRNIGKHHVLLDERTRSVIVAALGDRLHNGSDLCSKRRVLWNYFCQVIRSPLLFLDFFIKRRG